VLDLLDGVVVHAVRGERANYAPLRTPLATTSDATAVFDGLLTLHPFRHCYIADLNAIQHRGNHDSEIAALAAQHATCEFWVDAAFGARATLPHYARAPNVRLVIGSESLPDLAAYRAALSDCTGEAPPLLSLDHRRGEQLGPAELFDEPRHWPPQVIAMNLDFVGSGRGPDFELLKNLQRRAPQCDLIAAGGVRDGGDLQALRSAGVAAVLLASALHDGRIRSGDLAQLAANFG